MTVFDGVSLANYGFLFYLFISLLVFYAELFSPFVRPQMLSQWRRRPQVSRSSSEECSLSSFSEFKRQLSIDGAVILIFTSHSNTTDACRPNRCSHCNTCINHVMQALVFRNEDGTIYKRFASSSIKWCFMVFIKNRVSVSLNKEFSGIWYACLLDWPSGPGCSEEC